MILYSDTVGNFISSCSGSKPIIGQTLLNEFKANHIGGGSPSEYNSWIHSLPKVAEALKDNSIPKEAGVGVEYKLVDTKQRVDFLIFGKDEENKENVILIELKQWSQVRRSSLKDYVVTDGGHGMDDYWHPSYQALNYANIMKDFNEYIYTNKVGVNACSYLHNMPEGYEVLLKNEKEYPLVHEAPAFLKDDQKKLSEFIAKYIKKPYSHNTLYEIDSSQIRPSKGFSKMVADAINGEPFFSYDAEQSYSVSKIVSEVQEALEKGERRTIIVRGGPGSGKSIVAINALGQLMHPKDGSERRNACYVTANFTPRTYFGDILTKDFTKKAIKELFKTPAAFAKSAAYDFDCIIVDEAHRMLKWKFGWGVQRNVDVIDKLFNASRVNVFLIDEDQVVTTSDDLSIKQIKEYAEKYGSKVIEDNRMILSSQFRCVGGEQYISFVNHFLGYTNDYVSLKGMKYKVGIMDSMKDMMKKWNELWDSNHQMRLMAGYTHEWVSQYNPDKYDFEYEDGTNLRWNIKKADRAAILDDTQKENVFCIHTIQGLEVEYAGVIIGKDLTYNKETGKIEFHKEMNARSDSASGVRTADDALAEKLIRNTYKVLLTRGVKGTFIYAEDDNLREYLKQLVKN